MKIISRQHPNDHHRHYSNEWDEKDISDFLKREKVADGELVALYSAPKNWEHASRRFDEELSYFVERLEACGYSIQGTLEGAPLTARIWTEEWRSRVETIRECGGKPVILVWSESHKDALMQPTLMERLHVELMTIQQWRDLGGPWTG
jgi:hypothetical protein